MRNLRKSSRLISVIMTVILICGMTFSAIGCSGQKTGIESILDPSNPVKIVIWHYYNGKQQNSFNELVDKFNCTVGAEKGIIVEAHSYGSVDELALSIKDSLNGKVGAPDCPDIFSAYKDNAYEFDKSGKMVDLSEYFTADELGKFADEYIKDGHILDDSIKLIPVVKSTELMFLNKTDWDIFASETGTSQESLSTWEGVAKTAELYYKWSGGKAFFGRDAMANYIFVGCCQLQSDFYTVDSSGKVQYNIDKATIKKLWDNYYIPYVKGYYTSQGKFRSDDAKTGKLIACIASSSSANYFPTSVTLDSGISYSIDVQILPTPGFEGYSSFAIQQGAGMGVMKSDKQHEYAACEFLKWFTDAEQNCSFSVNSGYLPVGKDVDVSNVISDTSALTTAEKALTIGMSMINTYNYYETPVFNKADELRNTAASLFSNQCKTDRMAVEEQINAGTSYDAALSTYISNEYFDNWYETFVNKVTSIK